VLSPSSATVRSTVCLDAQRAEDAPGPGSIPRSPQASWCISLAVDLLQGQEEIIASSAYRLKNPVTVVHWQTDHCRLIQLRSGSVFLTTGTRCQRYDRWNLRGRRCAHFLPAILRSGPNALLWSRVRCVSKRGKSVCQSQPGTRCWFARNASRDQRLHRRYPLTLDVEYKLFRKDRVALHGFGKTFNISSAGVLLSVDDSLPIASLIEFGDQLASLPRGVLSVEAQDPGAHHSWRCQGSRRPNLSPRVPHLWHPLYESPTV
jgi:hypothetical protein